MAKFAERPVHRLDAPSLRAAGVLTIGIEPYRSGLPFVEFHNAENPSFALPAGEQKSSHLDRFPTRAAIGTMLQGGCTIGF
jgi:hypothetical protein